MPRDLDLDGLRHVATAVAYRMVGSRTEAEDLAQEALVRVAAAAEREDLRSPEAFTTTVATRLSIDHLRLARVQREEYLGPWLPEPISADALHDGADAAEVADSLSFALLSVLEALGPVERAAFLLREVFGYGYDEVAVVLDRSAPACRQLVARARRRVEGRHRIARFLRSIGPRALGSRQVEVVEINGEPGFLALVDGEVVLAGAVEVADGRVRAVRWVLNPDKLRWVHAP